MNGPQKRVMEFVRRHRLLEPGRPLVLAFSGGPDSVALALVLQDLSGGPLPLSLHLAYMNHGLRGQESEAEEQFVREFASRHALPLAVERPADLQERTGSLEGNARQARYEFLLDTAERVGAPAVATAHHADDVAESVLQRIIRGAGVQGLAAIRPARRLAPGSAVRLVRPLLELRKEELLGLLARRGESWCTDRTNRETEFQRNRVRHELLPHLARNYPQFSVDSLCALNTSAREAAELIQRDLDEAWPELAARSAPGISLREERLANLPAALRKAAALRALEALARPDPPPALRAEHLEALAELAREEQIGRTMTLPRGYLARREHGALYIGPRAAEEPGETAQPLPLDGSMTLPWAGRCPGGLRLETEVLAPGTVTPAHARERSAPLEVFLDLDALEPPLTVRPRRPGDVFHPLGAPGRRKLKDFLIDEHVPRHLRARLPLVVDSAGHIAWVGECRASQPARVKGSGERVLHVSAHPVEPCGPGN